MRHIPLLRGGKPYRSLSTKSLTDIRNGGVVAEISQANPGLIARDFSRANQACRRLSELNVRELLDITKAAGELFVSGDLPVGDQSQSPDDYIQQLSATTGLPQVMARRNMKKIEYVLTSMETVLGGLTRGLDLDILDQGWGMVGTSDQRCVSYRRETTTLGAVLPSNSPGVHALWLPAIPLKVTLALKPGAREPWTPYRVAQSFIAAGCPPEALGFYPTDYSGAREVLMRSGRSLLFGDRSTVDPWRHDHRIQIHGPGWSKVVFGRDQIDNWRDHLDLMEQSVADNGGRSCINASGIWASSNAFDLALGLAERLAQVEAHSLDHPEARLAAFPSVAGARQLSDHIDAQLGQSGAEDLTARFRSGDRVREIDGCAFLLPTVVYCSDPSHPLAQAEYLFPFVSVVEVPSDDLLSKIGSSLVVTALTEEPPMIRELLTSSSIERLNLRPVPTSHVDWDQPHEGNLFEHLYRQRALQSPYSAVTAGELSAVSSPESA
jgi:acyl-CoA reductase-like NAD-dependent aldehyde dehydrogenase